MSQEELHQFAITQDKLDTELYELMAYGKSRGFQPRDWVAVLFMLVKQIQEISGLEDISITHKDGKTPEGAVDLANQLNSMIETKGVAH